MEKVKWCKQFSFFHFCWSVLILALADWFYFLKVFLCQFHRYLWNLLQRNLWCEGQEPWVWTTAVQNSRNWNGRWKQEMISTHLICSAIQTTVFIAFDVLFRCATWCRHRAPAVLSFLVHKIRCIFTSSWRNWETRWKAWHRAVRWKRQSTLLTCS